ncbi:MAG TPA: NAD(P)-dependent oxidoreductase [Geminicoccaceae bacterium]|nr:NAD(P)-dependent oxidoreductase [Geminicoccaceae bacterium]
MQKIVGFIGLGAMGLPIAGRLARAGFSLVAFDPDPRALEAVLAAGEVERAASPGAVAKASEILITCLPHPRIVEAVYGEVAKPGLLACDCSTVGPTLAIRLHAELAAGGMRYLECPMLGAPAQAARGELFLILSGDEAAAAELAPIFEVISRGQRFVGGPGQASRIKVVQNGLGLIQAVAIGEALSILAKAGADLKAFCEVVAEGGGMAASPLFRAKARAMLEAEPPVLAKLRIGAKDIALACALAEEQGVPAPLLRETARILEDAMRMDLGESDLAALGRAVERRAGVSFTGS